MPWHSWDIDLYNPPYQWETIIFNNESLIEHTVVTCQLWSCNSREAGNPLQVPNEIWQCLQELVIEVRLQAGYGLSGPIEFFLPVIIVFLPDVLVTNLITKFY